MSVATLHWAPLDIRLVSVVLLFPTNVHWVTADCPLMPTYWTNRQIVAICAYYWVGRVRSRGPRPSLACRRGQESHPLSPNSDPDRLTHFAGAAAVPAATARSALWNTEWSTMSTISLTLTFPLFCPIVVLSERSMRWRS
jgi:hypothetical protein